MNAVEIEQAITDLAELPFDRANFPYAFLEAFGNKETAIKRLRAGASNKSDLGGMLQTNNVHIATCDSGQVSKILEALKDTPATSKAKSKFILATDGVDFDAEKLTNGETVACTYKDFPDHFGVFLPLAGISATSDQDLVAYFKWADVDHMGLGTEAQFDSMRILKVIAALREIGPHP